MQLFFPFLSFGLLVSGACAFGLRQNHIGIPRSTEGKLAGYVDAENVDKRILVDYLNTPIEVDGHHAFIAPDFGNGAQRGPCPGLNALANHGYISRSGVVGMAEVISAINSVYGMGIDLATILGVMGTVDVGNPLSLNPGFSIGGASPKSSNLLGNMEGLLGTPRGLYGSHNFIESDSSNTRDDLYMTGDAWTMNLTLFTEAYNDVKGDVITMADIGDRAASRFEYSKRTNPLFYYGPYTGLVARNAGYAFAGRLFANYSRENLEGVLTKSTFKSFFAVTTPTPTSTKFTYKVGHERIPRNWYRRPIPYGLISLNLDLITWVSAHPAFGSIGGNTGTVNSFAGVDLGDLASGDLDGGNGGVLGLEGLLKGNNLVCFAMEVVRTFSPNALSGVFKSLEPVLGLIDGAVGAALSPLTCPAFTDLTVGGESLYEVLMARFPGAKRSGSAL